MRPKYEIGDIVYTQLGQEQVREILQKDLATMGIDSIAYRLTKSYGWVGESTITNDATEYEAAARAKALDDIAAINLRIATLKLAHELGD